MPRNKSQEPSEDLIPPLFEGDEVIMSSLSELVGLLDLSKAMDLPNLVKIHSKHYRDYIAKYASKGAPTQFLGFIIPLDSYLPLPQPYSANVVYPGNDDKLVRVSLAFIESVTIEVTLGKSQVKAKLSVVVASLGDDSSTTKKLKDHKEDLQQMYMTAIDVANNVVAAYKLTPFRHNHHLRQLSLSNRPSNVDIVRFDASNGTIIEQDKALMQQNMLASVMHARGMTANELDSFRNIHLSLSSPTQALIPTLINTIYNAIDEGCVGNYSHSVVLADTYAEHFLRHFLSEIYYRDMDEDAALSKLDEIRSMNKLLAQLARSLNMTLAQFKEALDYAAWQKHCRITRNHLTHRFANPEVTPEESRQAIKSAIEMTCKLADIIQEKYPDTEQYMRLYRTPIWYVKTLEKNKPIDSGAESA